MAQLWTFGAAIALFWLPLFAESYPPGRATALVVVVLLGLYILMRSVQGPNLFGLVPVTSGLDSRVYFVRDARDKVAAADLLATLTLKVEALIANLPLEGTHGPAEVRLRDRFAYRVLSESPAGGGGTSYTTDKKWIKLCLRSKGGCTKPGAPPPGVFHSEDLLMYVLIHECAHLGNKSQGHDACFLAFNEHLNKIAVSLGLFNPENVTGQECYCGTNL